MDLVVSTLSALALGGLLGAVLVAHRHRSRDEDLRLLFDFLRTVGADGIDRRLPEAVEAFLGSGVNDMLDAMSYRYHTAERRGLEWEKSVDALHEVVCVLDSQGRIVRSNRALAARVGVDVRQVRGMKLEELLYPDAGVAAAESPIAVTRRTERPAEGAIASCALGRGLTVTTAPVRRDYGESMVCVVIRDEGEDSTIESRSRKLGRLMTRVEMPVILAEAVNGRVSFGNAAFLARFGYDELDAKGLNLDHLCPDDDEETRLALRALAHDDSSPMQVMTLRTKSGHELRQRVYAAAHIGDSGRAQALLYIFAEATEAALGGPRPDPISLQEASNPDPERDVRG